MLAFRQMIEKIRFHTGLYHHRKSATPSLPTHIQIESTVRCNLACQTCTRESVISSYRKMDMSGDEIDHILNSLPNLTSIKLQGLGEPLLMKDLDDVLERIGRRKIRLWTISNGTVLNNERNRERLLQNFRDVSVSIDSADPDLFKQLRPPAKLADVVEGTRELVRRRNERRSPLSIGITFCVHAGNIQEIEKVGSLGIQMGVDYVSFGLAENWTIPGDVNHEAFGALAAAAFERRHEIARRLSSLKLKLLAKGIVLSRNNWEKRLGRCHWPFKSLFINVEGEVTPCCVRSQRSHSLGNIFKQDIREIWNGPAYRELRNDHTTQNESSRLCGRCPL